MKKIFLILIILSLFGCGRKNVEKISKTKFLFGTMINITVYTSDRDRSEKNIEKTFSELQRIDNKFNSHTKGSIVDKINSNPGSFYQLDEEGKEIFKEVLKASKLTKGRYDITITPLMDLWGFFKDEKRKTIPSEIQLKKARERVDYRNIELKDGMIRLKTNKNTIDTGSFLKGYAIEKGKEVLIKNKEDKAFISAVSSIETIGNKPQNQDWKIGIQDPKAPGMILHIVHLKNRSMGVSGDYQTYIEIDGEKYHHLLDKETGYPIRDKRMVVVIGKNSFIGDLYSTAFFSMKTDEVIKIANTIENLEVLVVEKDMKEVSTKKFKNYLVEEK